MSVGEEKLYLQFHGRIIDSLGIQMYQNPVAAVAELIANAWDADASNVAVKLPANLSGISTIIVCDDGIGMTFEQCQKLYLNIGRNRRIDDETAKTPGGRPVLGRKGIGKFAGFGIAELLEIDTTSAENGERTVFHLDLSDLRGDEYIGTAPKEVPVLLHEQENTSPAKNYGTIIKLANLTLRRTPSESSFAASMARRFLINQTADEFKVTINDLPLPEDNALMGVEYDFPTDYKESEKPAGFRIVDGVGYEKIGEDEIGWRIRVYKGPDRDRRVARRVCLLRDQGRANTVLLRSVRRSLRADRPTVCFGASEGGLSRHAGCRHHYDRAPTDQLGTPSM